MTRAKDEIHDILSFSVEPIHDDDRVGVLQELNALAQEDPRVKVSSSEDGLIVSGEDELELKEFRGKILQGSRAIAGELRINFRETIRKPAEAEGKYIRHIGESGNYGHVKIHVEPNRAGKGFEFINDIKGGALPTQYIQCIEQGIQQTLLSGVIAGYKIIDVKATLVGGSYHDADCNELAFQIAGSMAFKEAARKANPVVLEPVMSVEVLAPERDIADILADLHSRRGRIEGFAPRAGAQVVKAIVPLAEMLSFSNYGRPRYSMQFAGYEPASPHHGHSGDDTVTYAKKPWSPKPRTGSAGAEPED